MLKDLTVRSRSPLLSHQEWVCWSQRRWWCVINFWVINMDGMHLIYAKHIAQAAKIWFWLIWVERWSVERIVYANEWRTMATTMNMDLKMPLHFLSTRLHEQLCYGLLYFKACKFGQMWSKWVSSVIYVVPKWTHSTSITLFKTILLGEYHVCWAIELWWITILFVLLYIYIC